VVAWADRRVEREVPDPAEAKDGSLLYGSI
jgi:hypothetical protein